MAGSKSTQTRFVGIIVSTIQQGFFSLLLTKLPTYIQWWLSMPIIQVFAWLLPCQASEVTPIN